MSYYSYTTACSPFINYLKDNYPLVFIEQATHGYYVKVSFGSRRLVVEQINKKFRMESSIVSNGDHDRFEQVWVRSEEEVHLKADRFLRFGDDLSDDLAVTDEFFKISIA
jgi:hypothetical protein